MILKTEPELKGEYNLWGHHIFEFKKELDINSENQFKFFAKTIKNGDFSGNIKLHR